MRRIFLIILKKLSALNNNSIYKRIKLLINVKKSNICCNIDLKNTKDILDLLEVIGPLVIYVSINYNNIIDFNNKFIHDIKALKEKYYFLICNYLEKDFNNLYDFHRLDFWSDFYISVNKLNSKKAIYTIIKIKILLTLIILLDL